MKKILSVLLALAMILTLAGCSGSGSSDSSSSETGKVYYLNFKPEADETLQALAKTYTEKTGVEVKVVTAASGTYETTLISELGKTDAPTIFNVGNGQSVATYGDYCLDLKDTPVYNEMTTHGFDQVGEDGKVYSIGNCYETFGLIANKTLIEKAGYSVDDITNFATLKEVADGIHANAATLGFDAFARSGLSSDSYWRFSGHLTNTPLFYTFLAMGQNTSIAPAALTNYDEAMVGFKNIWDLYITDCADSATEIINGTVDEARQQFISGKAVFYQNGTWEYQSLIDGGLTDDDIQMIPIYTGVTGEENYGLNQGTENCWAVNCNATEADQQASLDFLYWLVTDTDAVKTLADCLGAIPFKSAPASSNKFVADGDALLAAGKSPVAWAFNCTPNTEEWRAPVTSALQTYTADPTDANWASVVSAFVDGWATQYAAANK